MFTTIQTQEEDSFIKGNRHLCVNTHMKERSILQLSIFKRINGRRSTLEIALKWKLALLTRGHADGLKRKGCFNVMMMDNLGKK